MLVVAAYLDVLALQALAVLFDPLTRWHSAHPRNVALVAREQRARRPGSRSSRPRSPWRSRSRSSCCVLTRRAKAATPAARRQLTPVLIGGKIALLFFSVGLVLAPLSSRAWR